jgi:hypothetical protein
LNSELAFVNGFIRAAEAAFRDFTAGGNWQTLVT